MSTKAKSTETVAATLIVGGVREKLGTTLGSAVELVFTDCAGSERVRVEFYRGRAAVFSQGIHAIKTLSGPASGECGLKLVHSSGATVFIKAAGMPRVRLIASCSSRMADKPEHRARTLRRANPIARLSLLTLVAAVVFALTACSSVPKNAVQKPASKHNVESVTRLLDTPDDPGARKELQKIALAWNAQLWSFCSAAKYALALDEPGATSAASSGLGRIAAGDPITFAINAIVTGFQLILDFARKHKLKQLKREMLEDQLREAKAEIKAKLHASLDELSLTRCQLVVERASLKDAQANLDAAETLINQGLLQDEPWKERTAARQRVEDLQRKVYALEREDKQTVDAVLDLVGAFNIPTN